MPASPLALEMTLLVQRKTEHGWESVMVRDGDTLFSNDNIKLFFRTNEDCYVYAFIHDSTGKAESIFPHAQVNLSNRAEGHKDYFIPPGQDWFWLDKNTGTETIYVIASYKPLNNITKLLMAMEQAGAQDQVAASNKLEEALLARGIGGVRPGDSITYNTTDGKRIEKVTEAVSGKVEAVRQINFQHR